MNIIFKKALRGFVSGLIFTAALYLVFFVIELFSFFKQFLANTNLSNDAISGNAGGSFSLSDYVAFLPFWDWFYILLIAGGACVLGTIIGIIIGCVQSSDKTKKVQEYNMSVLEDGSGRQKILFASNIKTMAETLTDTCGENLHYMSNFVRSDYSSAEDNNAIMTELVKFIDYEQAIKECINNKKGGC